MAPIARPAAAVPTPAPAAAPTPAPAAAPTTVAMAKPAPAPRTQHWKKADARVCLEFPNDMQIIKCSENYR